MFDLPELYDNTAVDPLAVYHGEEWPEIPDDPQSQERLLQDANAARDRLRAKQNVSVDATPADAWTDPKYVEPTDHASPSSTREQRTEMAKTMYDHIPCANCTSLFPIEALDYCDVCMKVYCFECIGIGRICVNCRPDRPKGGG